MRIRPINLSNIWANLYYSLIIRVFQRYTVSVTKGIATNAHIDATR